MNFKFKEYRFEKISDTIINVYYHDTLFDCWGAENNLESQSYFEIECFKYLENEEGKSYIAG